MREIKFRVWDKHVKKMGKVTEIIFSNVQETLVKYQYINDYGKTIDEQSHIDDKGHGVAKLLQYTGLKDKNGREIYEGDIIKWGHLEGYEENPVRIAVVEFNPDIQYRIINTGDFRTNNIVFHHGAFLYGLCTNKALEIIGNIYEHEHLLKEVT